ncbi:hypothetical protein NDU88_004499 [Pleurodeles waltl]|uniref:Uncharacterized protein n=1 Tax=Pleurodeles waltl TaxID=8319 RepID=A0AAV7T8B9_PLEWA|nr:hypothetical protein NDU88_004499 [Pleurodeles waltl]
MHAAPFRTQRSSSAAWRHQTAPLPSSLPLCQKNALRTSVCLWPRSDPRSDRQPRPAAPPWNWNRKRPSALRRHRSPPYVGPAQRPPGQQPVQHRAPDAADAPRCIAAVPLYGRQPSLCTWFLARKATPHQHLGL